MSKIVTNHSGSCVDNGTKDWQVKRGGISGSEQKPKIEAINMRTSKSPKDNTA
jgi:hypothetical protein